MTIATSTPPAAELTWTEQTTKLRSKFSNLTDSDLSFEEGKKDEMLAKVQVKLGKSKEELAAIIASL